MGYRIALTPAAQGDLEQIRNYVVLQNAEAARRLRVHLITEIKALASFPHLGRVMPERPASSVRELVRTPYRIFYQVNEEQKLIEVLRFWHAARGTPLT